MDNNQQIGSISTALSTTEMTENDRSKDKNIKILAWDYSGSTGGSDNYFKVGEGYLKQFASQFASSEFETFYLLWDDRCRLVTLSDVQEICRKKEGHGSTNPSQIVEWIKKSFPSEEGIELWLITDGQIDQHELNRCSILNQHVNYSKIKFMVIDSSTTWTQDASAGLSVGASFFSGSEIEIFSNDLLLKKIDTSKPFQYDLINVANFDEQWIDLSDYIKFKFMGSGLQGLQEVDKLNKLRNRLLSSIIESQKNDKKKKSKAERFKSMDKKAILAEFKELTFYKNMTQSEVKDTMSKIDGSISSLINYIHNDNKSYGFDRLKMSYKQGKLSEKIEEEEPQLDSLTDVQDCNFYDAVTLENERGSPVLLLTQTDLISKYWESGNYSKFRAVMDCPLFAKIDECIGHVYLMDTFQALCFNAAEVYDYNIVNPMTNQPVFGGLIFSQGADAWNDYVLSKTFFRGKKVNTCMALWYYVIWKHAKDKNWIDESVAKQMEAYAFRRLRSAKARLALSSLPLDPKDIVPLHIALFYCTEGSSVLFGEYPELFVQERLRMFHSVSQDMLDILQRLEPGLEINVGLVNERARVWQLVNQLKRIPQIIEKRLHLLRRVFKSTPEGFLTYCIKDRDELKYLSLLKYDHKSMIPFDFFNKTPVDFRSFTVTSYKAISDPNVKLCMNTFRPFFVINDLKKGQVPYYKDLRQCLQDISLTATGEIDTDEMVKNQKGEVRKLKQSKVISYCKFYIDLVAELKKFPSWEEFVAYVLVKKRAQENDKIFLLSPEISENLKHYFDLYSGLGVKVDEFIEKSTKSTNIETRIEMEGVYRGSKLKEFVENAKSFLG